MSEQVGSAYFDLSLQKQGFDKGLNDASKSISDFGNKMSSLGQSLTTAITLPIAGIGVASFKMAADFNDAIGATEQIFKGQSENMLNWVDNLETYYGLAKSEALSYANTMGAMLQNIGGLTEEQASKQAQTLIQLAGDLTAMYGGTVQDAVRALTGSLKGNNTMLDNYGMAVNDVMIKTRALEMGLIKEGEELSLTSKQAATLSLIQEQSAFVTGQATREAEGASGALRTMGTEFKNLGIEIGNILIPLILPLLQKLNELLKSFKSLSPEMQRNIVMIGLATASIGPLLFIIGKLIVGIASVITFLKPLVLLLTGLNPVILIVVGVATALVAVFAAIAIKLGLLQPILDMIKFGFQILANTWNNVVQAFQSEEVQNKLVELGNKFNELALKFEPVRTKLEELANRLGLFAGEGGALLSVETAINIIIGVIDFFIVAIDGLITTINFLVSAFEKAQYFITNFGMIMGQIWQTIRNTVSESVNYLGSLLSNFFTVQIPFWLGRLIGHFLDLPNKIQSVFNTIATNAPIVWEQIKNRVTLIVTTLINSAVMFFQTLPGRLSDIWNGIKNFFIGQVPEFNRIGVDMITGFWNGLKSSFVAVEKWVKQKVEAIKNAFKEGLKIKSPSKVFDYFGDMIGQGFRDGVNRSMALAIMNFEKHIDKLKGSSIIVRDIVSKIKDEFKDMSSVISGLNSVYGELNNELQQTTGTRVEGEEAHALRVQEYERQLKFLELKKLERELTNKNTKAVEKEIEAIEMAKRAEQLRYDLTIGEQKQYLQNLNMFGTSSERSFAEIGQRAVELTTALRPVSDLMSWGDLSGVTTKEGLINAIDRQASQSVQVNLNPSGIFARSRSEIRDVAIDMVNLINDELRARGVTLLADGVTL